MKLRILIKIVILLFLLNCVVKSDKMYHSLNYINTNFSTQVDCLWITFSLYD